MSSDSELKKHPLIFYIKQNKRAFALGMFFLLITNSLDGIYPLVLKKCIDLVAAQAPKESITQTALLFFFIMAGLAFTRFLWRIYFGQYHTDSAEDLRNRIFNHLTQMSPRFFKRNPVGEILSIIINDVQAFRTAIGHGVLIFVDGISIIIIILPLMIMLNPGWTWKTLILLPFIPFMIKKLTQVIFATYKVQQDKLAHLSGVSQEIVAGIRVIKSFAQEKNKLSYYNKSSAEYEKACNTTARWDSLFMPVMEFGVAAGSVILIFVGAKDVMSGAASIGTFVAFQRYISKMVWPMTALGMGYSHFQKGMASFQRIRQVLDQQSDIPDLGQKEIGRFESLEVRDLCFQFDDSKETFLQNLNFKISAGQFVGIVGPVGAGKSTLLNLIARLYPFQTGRILINGIDIHDIKLASLRKIMTLVPQESFLFSETIATNLNYGLSEPADEEELRKWARAVEIENEIATLPAGFDSQLGERGVNLSGGQKQRLTLARSLITKSQVILLDDSLSAVDIHTEEKIKQAIEDGANRTRIVVTHRLNTIESADHIIVMKDGLIEASGTHHQLLQSSTTYRTIAQLQGYQVEAKP